MTNKCCKTLMQAKRLDNVNKVLSKVLSFSSNFYFFQFWKTGKIVLTLSLWKYFPDNSLAFWLFESWKKVGKNMKIWKQFVPYKKRPPFIIKQYNSQTLKKYFENLAENLYTVICVEKIRKIEYILAPFSKEKKQKHFF